MADSLGTAVFGGGVKDFAFGGGVNEYAKGPPRVSASPPAFSKAAVEVAVELLKVPFFAEVSAVVVDVEVDGHATRRSPSLAPIVRSATVLEIFLGGGRGENFAHIVVPGWTNTTRSVESASARLTHHQVQLLVPGITVVRSAVRI